MKTQYKIINACYLLYNFIKEEMPIDPMEYEIIEGVTSLQEKNIGNRIIYIETSDT